VGHIQIEFTIPMCLLAGALVFNIALRLFARWSEQRAKARTARLLQEVGIGPRHRASE
jgi:hypothetical protein